MTVEIRRSGDIVIVNEQRNTVDATEQRYTVSVSSAIIIKIEGQ